MASTIGTLLIELKAKTDAFEKGMKSAKDLSFATSGEIVGSFEKIGKSLLNLKFNNFDQMGKSMAILGGVAAATGVAITTSLFAVAEETSKKMVEMSHAAEKAGMGIKEFSEYAYAAKRSGVGMEEFQSAMSKLAKTAFDAASGNEKAGRALQLAGTSAADANGRLRPTADILADISKKYDTLTDRTLKAALARELFGKGGVAMIPMLAKGSEALNKFRQDAERLGLAFDEKTLDSAKKFRGEIAQFKAVGEGFTMQLTAGMLPALVQIGNAFTTVYDSKSGARAFGETVGGVFRGIATAILRASEALEIYKNAWSQYELTLPGHKKEWHADTLPQTQEIFDYLQSQNLPQEQQKRLDDLLQQYMKRKNSGENDAFGNGIMQGKIDRFLADVGTSRQGIADKINSPESRDREIRNRYDQKVADLSKPLARVTEEPTGAGTGNLAPKLVADYSKVTNELEKLIEKSRQLTNRVDHDPLATQIDNLKHLKQELINFGSVHQETWTSVNAAIEKVDNAIAVLGERTKVLFNEPLLASLKQHFADTVGMMPNAVPLASGRTQTQAALSRDLRDPNELNRMALEVYQQTKSAADQYAETLVKLDALKKQEIIDEQQYGLAKRDAYRAAEEMADQMLMKTKLGSAGAKVFFREFVRDAKDTARQVQEALQTAVNGINDALTSALMGQNKADNWKRVLEGTGKSLIQSGIKQGEAVLAEHIPGLGKILSANDPLGSSESKPMFVKVVGSGGGISGQSFGGDSFFGSMFGGLLSSAGGGAEAMAGIGSTAVSELPNLGLMFGGFFADGGSPDPNKVSVVGERGMELFTPKGVRGSITSNKDLRSMLGGSGSSQTIVNNIDARGTNAADVEWRVREAQKATHRQAVQDATMAQREMSRRRPAGRG